MIRCLIVDDSPTFRGVLRNILRAAPDVLVVGEAADGEEAIARAIELEPDVITMDVCMPRRDGLEAIREIMRRVPRPIVVISNAVVGPGEQITFQALKLGAIEVLPKPDALQPHHFAIQSEAIRRAVRAVAGLSLVTRRRDPAPEQGRPVPTATPTVARDGPPACVGIGASTGGPPALQRILSALPADYPAPILVVQHIAEGFVEGLVRWIGTQCALKVRLAREGEVPAPGTVLFAPDHRHLMISLGRVRLDDSPPVKGLKPSVTLLFASLAREFASRAVGILLTGMGDDGAAGLKLMREQGAFTTAQGPFSSIVWGMPRVAVETGAAAAVLELEAIPGALLRLARAGGRAGALPEVERAGWRRLLLCSQDAQTLLALERALLGEYELLFPRKDEAAVDAACRHRPDAIVLEPQRTAEGRSPSGPLVRGLEPQRTAEGRSSSGPLVRGLEPQRTAEGRSPSGPLVRGLDSRSTRLGGASALEALRESAVTGHIPVILITREAERARPGFEGRSTAVVPTPIDPEHLRRALKKVLP